tara:strand:+ start:1130 stop:1855 length:726 start_codon:yes stop_codon:yes gene_type:complete
MGTYKKSLLICIVAGCLIVIAYAAFSKKSAPAKPMHTVYAYANIVDGNFDLVADRVKDIIIREFNGDAVNNIQRVKFSKPDDADYNQDVHLQVYHPKGGGVGWIDKIRGLTTENSDIIFTLYNQAEFKSDSTRKILDAHGITEKKLPAGSLSVVVTHPTAEACQTILKRMRLNAPIQQKPNLTPLPAKPTKDEVTILEIGSGCFQDMEGNFYYVRQLLNYRYTILPEFEEYIMKSRIGSGY